jgi:hypothetical protein
MVDILKFRFEVFNLICSFGDVFWNRAVGHGFFDAHDFLVVAIYFLHDSVDDRNLLIKTVLKIQQASSISFLSSKLFEGLELYLLLNVFVFHFKNVFICLFEGVDPFFDLLALVEVIGGLVWH